MHSDASVISEKITQRNLAYFRDYIPVEDRYFSLVSEYLTDGTRVLDYGAGPDFKIGRRLANKNVEIFSMDVDPLSIERNPNSHKVVCDGERIPFKNEYFDMIVFKYVFEHLRNPQLVLKECSRCLKQRGYIIFLCPNSRSYVSFLGRVIPLFLRKKIRKLIGGIDDSDTFPVYYRLNTPKRIVRVMKETGFNKVVIGSYVGYPTYWEFSSVLHAFFCLFHKLLEKLPIRSFDISLVGVFKKQQIDIEN